MSDGLSPTPVTSHDDAPAPDAPTPVEEALLRRRGKRGRALAYWLMAGALYIAVGVWKPQLTFLGFQESLIYVFAVTVAAPIVIPRLP